MPHFRPFSMFLFAITLFLNASCSVRVNELTTDDGTFQEGQRLLNDKYFDEARKQFNRIKTEFPNSPLQAEADLKIAESYFKEDSFKAAAEAYEDFVRFYPAHPQVPFALYQAGLSYSSQIPGHPQRDSRATSRAIDVFTRLLIDHPASEYRELAEVKINEAQTQLAQKDFQIADFYERQKKFSAASERFLKVYELYPNLPVAEEALARSILNFRKTETPRNLGDLVEAFETKFPNSKYRKLVQP